MRHILVALISGLLFGFGLMISGMTEPARILAFLDVTGDWNPALAFVMGAAVVSALPAFAYVRRKGRGAFGEPVSLPARGPVDRRLLVGAVIFGAGWGLSGFCPGPALVVAATGSGVALVFVAAMAAGMLLARALWPRVAAPTTTGAMTSS